MNDAEAFELFRACHAVMDRRSRLLIIGQLMGTGARPGPAAHSDLRMLVIMGDAEVRTEEELRTLLAEAGLSVTRIVGVGRAGAIVEAVRT